MMKKKTVDLVKKNLIDHIDALCSEISDKGFDLKNVPIKNIHIQAVRKYINGTERQALFFSMIFFHTCVNGHCNFEEIPTILSVSPLQVLRYSDDVDFLVKEGLVKKAKPDYRRGQRNTLDSYFVTQEAIKAVIDEVPIPVIPQENLDNIGLIEKVHDLINYRSNGEISYEDLYSEAESLFEFNEQLPMLKELEVYALASNEKLFLLYLAGETLNGNAKLDLSDAIENIMSSIRHRFMFKKDIVRGDNALVLYNLIESEENFFRDDKSISLTDKALVLLLGQNSDLLHQKKSKHLLSVSSIKEKKLFYNLEESKKIGFISDVLKDEHFHGLQTRLLAKGMPKGITILFHGLPGTGKTESVYQIARQTGRDMMAVDISDTKSMWFGESEKKIKRIFTDYHHHLKHHQGSVPILFLNEADAILGKRREVGHSSIDQTENAIQNILLQSLEDFEGILFATSNLINNLDTAFDRRFLFKVKFEKPTREAKLMIWKDKLPGVPIEIIKRISEEFDFPGGQIENIARKILMNSVLYNHEADFEQIRSYCLDESLLSRTKVGFL